MDLFLFANFFPYKRAEPFLVNEIKFARQYSRKTHVFTLYGRPSEKLLDTEGLHLFDPVFEDAGDKKKIFTKGIFNFAPFHVHLSEFFSKGVFLSPKKMYWFFVSVCITRAALASRAYVDLIREAKKSERPVLYFYWGDNLSWLIPYIARKVPHAKIVIRLHGSDLYEHLKADYAPIRKQVLKNVHAAYTVSEVGCNYLRKKYPSYSQKMSVARLGVFDHGMGPTPAQGITIVSVSNLVPVKRVHLLFQALQLLEFPVTWHHFGDGILFNELKTLVLNKRAGLSVHLHGYVANNGIINYYKNTSVDLFVNVSSSEGVPVSIMEALSFGIPVLATNAGGTGELVNVEVGELIEIAATAREIADSMARFFKLTNEEKAAKRKKARERFEVLASAEANYQAFYNKISLV
jgi:glycosyltransferase involved in cell wall biosynthesis